MTIASAKSTAFILDAAAIVETTAGKPARVSIMAYAGGIMRVPGFGDVAIVLGGLELPGQIPLLLDHDNRLRAVAGHGIPAIEGGKLIITGQILRDTDAGSHVLTLSRGGLALQASVGVAVGISEYIRPGESIKVNGRALTAPGPGGLVLVKTGRLREVSLTPAGADASTEVSIAAKAAKDRGQPMKTELEIRAEERERLAQIDGILDGLSGRRAAELRAAAAAEEISLDELKGSALDLLRASRPTAPVGTGRGAGASTPEILCAAVLTHLGFNAEKLMGPAAAESAHAMGCSSLVDVARAALVADGRMVPRTVGGLVNAAFSTLSLPVAMSDAANKIVLSSYAAAPASWRGFANVLALNDFKTAKTIRPSFNGQLQQVGPGGEVKHGTIGEETGEIKLDTFAQMLRIDRQDLINDDGSVFAQVASSLGKNASRAVADKI